MPSADSVSTPSLTTRVVRRLARSLENLGSAKRGFKRAWPHIDGIEGYLDSPGQEEWLYQSVLGLPDPAVIVEIGSFKGRSTACIGYACRGTGKRVFAIDTFAGNDSDFRDGSEFTRGPYFDQFWGNLNRLGLTDYVTPLCGLSADIAQMWRTPIDLLFIDGSHEFPDVLTDFENFFPWVREGGIVAFHDVEPLWPGPWKVWHEVAAARLVAHGSCSTIAFGRKPGV
jgi:hypothetical protein